MAERYIVLHSPKDPATIERQTFSRKGTAMAYCKKRVGANLNGPVELKRQVEGAATPDAMLDEKTGIYWNTLDTWKYHRDGRIEHVRACRPKPERRP